MSETSLNSSRAPGRASRTDTQASEFLIRRYDRDIWSDADQAELDTWLAASSANRTAYLRLKSAWTRANRLDALRPMSPRGGASVQSRIPKSVKFATVAALLALIGGAGWFLNQPSIQTFSTKVGERSQVRLSDGTRVELTTDTVLRVATGGTPRKAWLDKGEAFFNVVHDDSRPFELIASRFRIVDLGTEFSVRREPDRIRVMVLKGSVRVAVPDTQAKLAPERLTAGDVAIADARSINVKRKSSGEIADALGWRTGFLVFRYARLSDVAAEFNRYNSEKVIIDDPRVAKTIISARLQATDIGAFARMARDFMGLKVQRADDGIHISR